MILLHFRDHLHAFNILLDRLEFLHSDFSLVYCHVFVLLNWVERFIEFRILFDFELDLGSVLKDPGPYLDILLRACCLVLCKPNQEFEVKAASVSLKSGENYLRDILSQILLQISPVVCVFLTRFNPSHEFILSWCLPNNGFPNALDSCFAGGDIIKFLF